MPHGIDTHYLEEKNKKFHYLCSKNRKIWVCDMRKFMLMDFSLTCFV